MQLVTNWADIAIILSIAFFMYTGWKQGALSVLVGIVSFIASLLIALKGYSKGAEIISQIVSFPAALAKPVAFLIIAFVSEGIIGYTLHRLFSKAPVLSKDNLLNKGIGAFLAIVQGVVFLSFILTLALSLPITPEVKKTVSESYLGSKIILLTQDIDSKFNSVFGEVISESLLYTAIKPESNESVPLTSEVTILREDLASEDQMVSLVNQERAKVGVKELSIRKELIPVARAHAIDMWQRKYFSHYSPEGLDIGDRLNSAFTRYLIAGENLALAPTLAIAHQGLMNSEGHRHNILDPRFTRIGVGVIDNGIYGKMFVQVFTD